MGSYEAGNRAQRIISELKTENARLREALEILAEFETDWTMGPDSNMARTRLFARETLEDAPRPRQEAPGQA
jgi:hypothetical protein